MVPGTTVLSGSPGVCKVVARGYRALCDPIHTIHVHGLVLSNSMPMDTGPVVFKPVLNGNVHHLPIKLA